MTKRKKRAKRGRPRLKRRLREPNGRISRTKKLREPMVNWQLKCVPNALP